MSKVLMPVSIKNVSPHKRSSLSRGRVRGKVKEARTGDVKVMHDFKKSLRAFGHGEAVEDSKQDNAGLQREATIGHKVLTASVLREKKSLLHQTKSKGRSRIKVKSRGKAPGETPAAHNAFIGGITAKVSKESVKRVPDNGSSGFVNITGKAIGTLPVDYQATEAVLKSGAAAVSEHSLKGLLVHRGGRKGHGKGALSAHKGVKADFSLKADKKNLNKQFENRPQGTKEAPAGKAAKNKVKADGLGRASVERQVEKLFNNPVLNTPALVKEKIRGRASAPGGLTASKNGAAGGRINSITMNLSNRHVKAGGVTKKNITRTNKSASRTGHNKAATEKKELIRVGGRLKKAYTPVSEPRVGEGVVKFNNAMSLAPLSAVNFFRESAAGLLTGDGGAALAGDSTAGIAVSAAVGGGTVTQAGEGGRAGVTALHGEPALGSRGAALIKQAANGVVMSLNERNKEIVIELKPENLGHLKIKVRIEDGLVETSILVDNSRVMAMLNADAGTLKELLAQEGFLAGGLDVALDDNGNAFGAAEEFSGGKEGGHRAGSRAAGAEFSRGRERQELSASLMETKTGRRGLDLFI